MVGTKDSESADLRAELAALLERSQGLLDEEADELASGSVSPARDSDAESGFADGEWLDDSDLDALSGIELIFDNEAPPGEELPDPFYGANEWLREEQERNGGYLDALSSRIARNPLPWLAGALVLSVLGVRLLSSPKSSKNRREKASQVGDFPITHGSLSGFFVKTGIELAKPVLLKASKELLSQIVETRR